MGANGKRKLGCCCWFFIIVLTFAVVAAVVITITMIKYANTHPNAPPVPGPPGAITQKYADALKTATQFFDVQKSGKLVNNKISWRGDSALKDGSEEDVDLSKGDPEADHKCWQKPESMTEARPVTQLNTSSPGTEVAAEMAAALASASLVFKKINSTYSDLLLKHAGQLFTFANTYRRSYIVSIPEVQTYYNSTGYGDELLWAASWLYHATKDKSYLKFVLGEDGKKFGNFGNPTWFSWDNKLAGAQVLLSRAYWFDAREFSDDEDHGLTMYVQTAEAVMCGLLPKSPSATSSRTDGGLIWVSEWNALQHPVASAFLAIVYSDYMLTAQIGYIECNFKTYTAADLRDFAKSQADYVLGDNPMKMSYLVGYGDKYPEYVHHRGASIPADAKTGCKGFKWLESTEPNPNVAVGAMVGGPFRNETYIDSRNNSKQGEPTTYNSAIIVGLLSGLLTTSNHNVKKHAGTKGAESVQSIDVSNKMEILIKKSTESQALDLGDIIVDTCMLERHFKTEERNENVTEKRGVQQKRTASAHVESLITEVSASSGSNVLTYNSSSLSTKELEGMHGLLTGGGLAGDDFNSNSNGVVVRPVIDASVIPVNYEDGETKEEPKPNHGVGEAVNLQVPDSSDVANVSSREELHTFYEQNQDSARSVSNVRDLKSMSSHSIPQKESLSLLLDSLHKSEVSVQTPNHSSGSVSLEVTLPPAHYKDGSSSKGKYYSKGGEHPRSMVKEISSQTNGRLASTKHDPPKYLSTYNRLLRDGRLAACIELLQSMELKGLLDMDKIYHVKFFNICKSQKAVKEAFCFAKLIGNPTLSTFNMLLSVCASSQDSEGAFQVLELVKEAGLRADCKLYTTLISTCAKSGKVDTMFKVFHDMVNAGVEPNLHTYGSLIDGCARAGQVAKAFGAYGILRSKNVKPDRVVFNALISACGQSGAVDRAFDVLAEMKAEPTPVDPDHITVGALIKTCTKAGQFDRGLEVYKMISQYKIKGTPEVYTLAVSNCSQTGNMEFALNVYKDMTRNGVIPDEMFLSALIDVAGHAGKIDVAFGIVQKARAQGIQLGNITYGSLMGACSNAKDWQKALELYEDVKSIKLCPTVSMLNALVNALCDGDQLHKAVEVLAEMKKAGVSPNIITYSILLVGSEKKDDQEVGFMLYYQAKKEGIVPNIIMCKCLIGMCLRRFQKAYSLGEHVVSFKSGKPGVDSKWTSLALSVYRETIVSGVIPTMELLSLVLGCLQFPHDTSLRVKLIENLGVNTDPSKFTNLKSLIEGFGEYDPRSFSLLEEAASLGIVAFVSFKKSPIVVDVRKMQIHIVEVYLLTILKGLKHRLAAGAKLPNINIVLPVEKTQVLTSKEEKTIKLAGRVGQRVGALLRRLGIRYQGSESNGKIKINGLSLKRWLQPKIVSAINGKPQDLNSSEMSLGKRIKDQQRDIRMSNLST
ncbi:Pentatricopeptide repeat-containing protein mrl1 protein [Thalictrum thalictroides]|uniref:Endoglucanase n=2 Tax=Thalictrum thalictroides TaxID=46969 RepID=A0A7J6WM78_THATH|nr:Pentatricopeptide repeat-containing protein mrl1 protein [Thalictrum thalictroides]